MSPSPLRTFVVEPVESRRAAASAFGADVVRSPHDDVVGTVRSLTDGLGADVAIEAVGSRRPSTSPSTWFAPAAASRRRRAQEADDPPPGGPVDPRRDHHDGPVDTSTTPMLPRMLQAGRLDTGRLITHRLRTVLRS